MAIPHIVKRADETFRCAANVSTNLDTLTHKKLSNVHAQIIATKIALKLNKGPEDLISKLESLQESTSPKKRVWKYGKADQVESVLSDINRVALEGIAQVQNYRT